MFSSFFFFSQLIILSFRIIYHIICQKVCYIDFNLYFQTASIGSPQEFQSPAVIRTSTPTAHLAQGPLVTKKLPPASPKQYYIDPFNHQAVIPDIKIPIPQCSVQSDLHPFIQQCGFRDQRLSGQSVSNISKLHPQAQPVNQHFLYNQSLNKSNMMPIQTTPSSTDLPSSFVFM